MPPDAAPAVTDLDLPARPPAVGAWATDRGVRFRVWAPDARAVALVLGDDADGAHAEVPLGLDPDAPGHWVGEVEGIGPGARYRYRLDDGEPRPDPASRSQPDGVHGPSAVVDPAFTWTDGAFVPPALADSVFYELHVGTFTPDGTFDAVVPHLARLADLGVTTVELLPVAQFPGDRNWGYDGVFPYAVQDTYGGLDGLRHLVDAAHGTGLAVCLDVVHNHVGPEGNVLGRYGPYFTDRYRTPWGDALNFDGPGADGVRTFFAESAAFFAVHAHVDAFRLDAVHAIVDASAHPYVEHLNELLHDRARAAGRTVLVIAESADDDPRLTRPAAAGGWGLDGQWNDDFHHALHVTLTGEDLGYYGDYRPEDLATAFTRGFTHHGRLAPSRGHRVGHPHLEVDPGRLVVFSANHDQVGNRLGGDRLTTQVDAARARVAAAVVLLSPSLPLLFMGDEHGEEAPFPYFTSHTDPDLVEAVRRGRAEEFAAFAGGAEPPDPQAEASFRSAVLDHDRADDDGPGRARWELHRALLAARRGHRPQDGEVAARAGGGELVVHWRGRPDRPDLALLVAFEDGERTLDAGPGGWAPVVDTGEERWGGRGPARPDDRRAGRWVVPGPGAVLLEAAR